MVYIANIFIRQARGLSLVIAVWQGADDPDAYPYIKELLR